MKAKWSFALLGGVLIALWPVLAASASVPGVDGAGTITVLPATATYGTSTTFVFTYTSVGDIPLGGSSVWLSVPAGWSTPTAGTGIGHVSVSPGTCNLNGWAISGRDIIIDFNTCLDGHSLTVNYSGIPPSVAGSPFTFQAQTDFSIVGGNGLTPLNAGSPTLTVYPKPLIVSGGLTPTSKVYDGTANASLTTGTPALVGLVGADAVTLDTSGASASFGNRNAGTAKTVYISGLLLAGAQAGNYTISPTTRSANITRRPLRVTAVADAKVYDGTTASSGLPTLTGGAIQPGDTAPVWIQTFNNRNAGLGKILLPAGLVNDGNGGNNYSYTYATAAGSISKYPITITAVSAVKTYDRTVVSSGHSAISSGSLQPGDSAPAWVQTYNTPAVGTGKVLTPAGIVSDGNGGNNYSYTYAQVTGTIVPKHLAVSSTGLTPDNKIYDGTKKATGVAGTPTLVGVISGDTVTLVTAGATYAFPDKNAGFGKLVHVTGLTLSGTQAFDYVLTQPNRSASISKRALTVAAVTDNRIYDGTIDSAGLPRLTSGVIQPGDLAPVWTQTFNTKNVGAARTLTPAGKVVDGNAGNNYAYTFVTNATGVITKKAITVTAISDTKIYDGTTHSADIPNYAPALAGSDTAGFTQSFNTKDVGTGKTMMLGGIVNDGNGGNNYLYTFIPNSTGVITVRAITVTAVADSKAYDGAITSSAAPNVSPWPFGSDTASFSQVFDTKDVAIGKTLTPSGTVNDGNGGTNYTITFVANTAGVITPKPITVTAASQSKALGALDPALTYAFNPALLGGDIFTGGLARAAGETYGAYAISQGTLSAGGNYSITYVGASLLIGPQISGSVGVAGAMLSYTDGVSKTVNADGTGQYALIVASGWTGSVTPSKAGYAFSPVSKPYATPVTSDLAGQDYSAHLLHTLSFISTGALDGWVLESTQTSSVGGTMDAASAVFNLGDDAANKQYRSILSFSTSLQPAAVITRVTVKFKSVGKVGTNPFTMAGNKIMVDISKGALSNNSALQITDFQAPASKNAVLAYTNVPIGAWYSQALAQPNFAYINRSGVTQFRLYFAKPDNNNRIADYLTFYSGNAVAAYRPVLTVTYYLP